MRGIQKYLIVYDNEAFYCDSSRRRQSSNGRIQEVKVNEKENDRVIE